MKKITQIITAALTVLLLSSTAIAQSQPIRGNFIINPYYGGPNFGKSFLQSTTVNGQPIDNGDTKVSGVGPLGIRLGYMVTDNLSLGIDAIYNDFNLSTNYTEVDDNNVSQTYRIDVSSQRIRVHARMNYNFNVSSSAFNPYIGFGIGTNTRIMTVTDTGNGYEEDSESGSLIPFSARVALGANYFLTDNIAINLEAGLGGPLVSGGVSFKF